MMKQQITPLGQGNNLSLQKLCSSFPQAREFRLTIGSRIWISSMKQDFGDVFRPVHTLRCLCGSSPMFDQELVKQGQEFKDVEETPEVSWE
ncbi:hypothetical protein KY290_021827 [Solanum tuberosum]|uniref:Uncharacterized protein n=1 Tax=Solanum tuberosum TaxID=4113 RepID=A0ABQ7V484_SOLTU|nr:hypothetical protein KY289_020995 [Solanum tuberosum]KAH0758334.1 hypothetical protein KY290_021827 [Solanum tuberosum]